MSLHKKKTSKSAKSRENEEIKQTCKPIDYDKILSIDKIGFVND